VHKQKTTPLGFLVNLFVTLSVAEAHRRATEKFHKN